MKLQQLIEKHWYQQINPILTLLLYPLSGIYAIIVAIRKQLFKLGIKPSYKLSVPVVIVGNIGVGGAGKTPLTKYLAGALEQDGVKVGIILRGYKADNKYARAVHATDDSMQVGDEALIYANAGFHVVIGASRVDAGELLLKTYPDTQIILADDGMQHYKLQRDYEICVVDATRYFGNKCLLPMGSLREPISRLESVNHIVVNGFKHGSSLDKSLRKYKDKISLQELELIDFYNPITKQSYTTKELPATEIVAMAAIGNPRKFFDYLVNYGVKIQQELKFIDHYHYQLSDVPQDKFVITTEKDYVKISKFQLKNVWIARVSAKLDSDKLVQDLKSLL